MKALRYLLIAFAAMTVLSVSAQSMAQQPGTEFHSTSSMVGSGSTLPQAVQTGAYTTYDIGTPGHGTIKRIGGGNSGGGDGPTTPDDVFGDPVGDAALPLLFCAAVFSGVIAFRRKRQQQRNDGMIRDFVA